jgi:hypothetical protein
MRDERERLADISTQEQVVVVQSDVPRKAVPSGRDASAKEGRKRMALLQELENTIANLESRLAEISRKLENRSVNSSEVVKLAKEYQITQSEMDGKLAEWEKMQI